MSPEDPRHSTVAGYNAHVKDDETPCLPCRRARANYEKRRKWDAHNGKARIVGPTGTRRRVQALVALGWTYGRIGEPLGVTAGAVYRLATNYSPTIVRTTAERVAAVYEDMSMTLPPRETRVQKRDAAYAQTVARKRGWVTPLAWDDIDTDAEPYRAPTSWHPKRHTWKREDLLEEWAHLTSLGVAPEQAARQLGVTVEAVERAEFRARGGAA